MTRPAARLRWLWRVLRRSNQVDAEMRDEMRFHIDMEADRLAREHELPRAEAIRRAHLAFGGLEKFRQAGRETRGIQMIDAVALDARLGLRMLLKHRGLTLVGGFAMAVAIAVGATFFEVISELLDPALPLEDGRQIVAVRYESSPGNPERHVLREFLDWRQELASIEQLSAFRTVQHNLVGSSAAPEPIKVAEITASGFTVARVPPMIGRYLVPDDEREGAPAVVVIGHHAWMVRFGGDPAIVGQTVALGGVPTTVVGVMPDGFKFPVDHQFWIPLRSNPVPPASRTGPELFVFGRLAPAVSMDEAQAELTAAASQREAAVRPASSEPLRPLVIPFTREHLDIADPGLVWMLRIAQLLVGTLVFVVAINLAILVYARTVTRIGEIAIRTALGASRRRILGQLFVEALALAILGAAAGLLVTDVALSQMQALAMSNGAVPWWLDFDLSIYTVVYALALAAFAALIMGVVPGLRATGRSLSSNLHELNGRSGTRLGSMWTTLVVAQVAVAVAVLPVSVHVAVQVMRMEVAGPGFAADNFAVGMMALAETVDGPIDPQRLRARQLEMMARLQGEPGVSRVTFSSSVPGFAGGREIEFDRGVIGDIESADVSSMDTAPGLFETYGARVLAGRVFTTRDTSASTAVVVNRTFAEGFAPSGGILGLQFRYRRAPQSTGQARRYEIVGVVDDFPAFPPVLSVDNEPVVYHPAEPGTVHPFALTVKFAGAVPAGFLDRFRDVAAQVDAALQVRRIVALSTFYDQVRVFWRYLAWGATLLTTAVILLSAAGIYALMSFTVAQRTREIGIRAALGAAPHRLLIGVFGRAARQLALGLLAGSLLSSTAFLVLGLDLPTAGTLLLCVAGIMLVVGLVAAVGPARRGLRVNASEALRAD